MVTILLLMGAALVFAGYWANTAQAEQRRPVRVVVERERRRPRH